MCGLHPPTTPETALPTPAIRPYPVQYVGVWKSKNKERIVIRPIRPEDEPLMVKFHQTLSEQSVYQRYFSVLELSQRTAHERLTRIVSMITTARSRWWPNTGKLRGRKRAFWASAGLSKLHGVSEVEFALLVSDPWQGIGLGTELLRRIVQVGARGNRNA